MVKDKEKAPEVEEKASEVEEKASEVEEKASEVEEKASEKEEELVEVTLFKDNKDYKDDVFVAVNGKSLAIKRGEPVKIPKKFAEVLKNSLMQDNAAAKLMENEQDKFLTEAKERNI